MKFVLYFVMIFAAISSAAEENMNFDLAEPVNHPYLVDELDRAFTEDEPLASEKQEKNDTTMKIEMNQATPTALSPEEAMTPAEKLALENQKRQKAILTELSSSGTLVKNCIVRNNTFFRGTHITIQWVISPMGGTQKASIKSTDIGDLAIRDCIKRVAARFDFSDAAGRNFKRSIVEYTYKFNGKLPKANRSVGSSIGDL